MKLMGASFEWTIGYLCDIAAQNVKDARAQSALHGQLEVKRDALRPRAWKDPDGKPQLSGRVIHAHK